MPLLEAQMTAAADYSDVDDSSDIEMFPFRPSDKAIVKEAISLVKEVLRLPSLSGYDVHRISKVLYALERLPRPSPGIGIGLTVSYRAGDEMVYQDVYVGESFFYLSSGGSVYTPGVGSDHHSQRAFEVELDGYRSRGDVEDWANSFRETLSLWPEIEISFEELDDDNIEWETGPPEDYWAKLNE